MSKRASDGGKNGDKKKQEVSPAAHRKQIIVGAAERSTMIAPYCSSAVMIVLAASRSVPLRTNVRVSSRSAPGRSHSRAPSGTEPAAPFPSVREAGWA